jgi:hypothetical protein
MKNILKILVVCGSLLAVRAASADVLSCSDNGGRVLYNVTQTESGVAPVPGSEVGRTTLVQDGVVLLSLVRHFGEGIDPRFEVEVTKTADLDSTTTPDGRQVDTFAAALSAKDLLGSTTISADVICVHSFFRVPLP